MLEQLIASGRIVDLMLLFIAVEIVLLVAWRRWRGGGIPLLPLLVNIGAGGSLMMALRATLVGSGWPITAAWLVAAMLFHLGDLALRWQRPLPGP